MVVKALSGIRRISNPITSQTTWTRGVDPGTPQGFHVNGDGYVDILLAGDGGASNWHTIFVVGGIQHNFELLGLRPSSQSPIASGLFAVWQ